MQQRGRKSSAALEITTTSVLERVERPKAPHDLTDEEIEVWAAVVASEPADWFSPATLPLLSQYCRHAVHARRIAELLEKATGDEKLAITDYERLLKMQQRESAMLKTLATSMRISQQSTTNHRGNKTKSAARKPWEG